jgi:threonine dehydrogenase-like Zn-dependent dehydrogenase
MKSETIQIDDMITQQLPLKDIAKGFRMVMEGNESIKVIIKPHL